MTITLAKLWKETIYRPPSRVAILYLVAVTVAELLTTYVHPAIGLVAHSAILIALLVHIAITWEEPVHQLLLTLLFAPLIRLLSLSMPLNQFPQIDWYLIVSVPLFAAAYVIARIMRLSWSAVGFNLKRLPIQLLVGCSGFVFGFIEYNILKPEPLIKNLTIEQFMIPALILLISTGLMEELLFRGMMQKAGEAVLGRGSIFFATAIFMVLHIGYQSLLDLLFVFAVGLFWAWVVSKTHSIVGVTVSHGITNIMLFLVFPFLSSGLSLPNTPSGLSPIEMILYYAVKDLQGFSPYVPLVIIYIFIALLTFTFKTSMTLTIAIMPNAISSGTMATLRTFVSASAQG